MTLGCGVNRDWKNRKFTQNSYQGKCIPLLRSALVFDPAHIQEGRHRMAAPLWPVAFRRREFGKGCSVAECLYSEIDRVEHVMADEGPATE